MEELKQVEGKEEQSTKPTSEEVGVAIPPTEPEPPSEPTPEVAKLISAAEAAVQSAKDIEKAELIRQHKQELRQLKATQEEARLKTLEDSEKERFNDVEPDLLKEIQDLRRRVHATVTQTSDVQAHGYAYRLGRQYGVDPEVLLESASPEEMETKAKDLVQTVKAEAEKVQADKIKQLEEELTELKKAPQKIDSGTPSATGVDYSKMTARELIELGVRQQETRRK